MNKELKSVFFFSIFSAGQPKGVREAQGSDGRMGGSLPEGSPTQPHERHHKDHEGGRSGLPCHWHTGTHTHTNAHAHPQE